MAANRVALYASVGPELTQYDVDVEAATLTRRGTVTLPANVHYCWPHASRPILYAASSDSASGVGGFVGSNHHVTALAIDTASGALSRLGEPITLPTRPIHMTTDIPSDSYSGRVQQPERPQGLPRQWRRHAGRGSRAARADRPRHLRPPGPGQPRQPQGHPGDARPRRGRRQARGTGCAEGIRLQRREADQRGLGRAEWRLRVRPAPSRFPSDKTVCLCRAGAAEPARSVQIRRERSAVIRGRLPHQHARRTAQYPRPAGGRHGACASERPHCLCREPRLLDGRGERNARLCRRRELARGVRHRSQYRRAARRSSTSIRAASIAAPSISTRAGGCWSRRTSWGCRCATTAAPVSSRPACRCSASGSAAGSNSSANTMSMSATGRCGGWAWWRCRQAWRRSGGIGWTRAGPQTEPAIANSSVAEQIGMRGRVRDLRWDEGTGRNAAGMA